MMHSCQRIIHPTMKTPMTTSHPRFVHLWRSNSVSLLQSYTKLIISFHGLQRVDKGSIRGQKHDEPEPTCTKIYYASRTHSQLSQVLPELKKLKILPPTAAIYASSSSHLHPKFSGQKRLNGDDIEEDVDYPHWRTVSLGSRKQLCINDALRSKRGDLDEKCRELLGGKSSTISDENVNIFEYFISLEKKDKCCPHLPPAEDDSRMTDFRDQILVRIGCVNTF